jgi:ribonuclease-3
LEPILQGHSLTAVEELLGHRFVRPELLAEALTHRSAAHERSGRGNKSGRNGPKGGGSNERLEFVGDRVLGLVMAEWLLERFPHEQEGALGPRLAELVSRQTLVGIAEGIGLSSLLSVAESEAKAGVKTLATVMADAMEAVIGAIYLDSGLDAARRFIRNAWGALIELQIIPPKDPKTGLQEWGLARGLGLPVYRVKKNIGPSHAPRFTISVKVGNQSAEAEGGNKRDAERAAASLLLGKLS